ncbi:c-type cytochrome biogenesis protein CcmI [Jiella marina]|uniref:c-type cytochrome biogenesis protein CcmI n=1 Tax=Jiella sp. LLJ827 TaxID=2917712 RepID=UPI002100E697|nr:c-type cytochrome biogenesis protein CcmI [Jiella sp. LLJ827]MCQ0987610.1 c-type cytochrome biogenesis protein CcmI [Jiella sp. LLJ827]
MNDMMFWIVAAAMTSLVTLAMLWPLVRRQGGSPEAHENHDVEVYRAQLRELDQDLERGTLAPAEAESARAEIGRRLLRAADNANGKGLGAASWQRPAILATIVLVLLAIPVASTVFYATMGNANLPDQPLAARQQPPSQGDLQLAQLVERAEARLRDAPEDGQGWEVLAPIYLRLERPQDAANAYRKALDINGPSASRFGGLGEALTDLANGEVTDEAKSQFERALEINPGYLPAKFFLALDASQEERASDAETRWTELIQASPDNAPWMQIAQAGLADARMRLGKTDAPAVAPMANGAGAPAAGADGTIARGPDAEQVAAASQMSDTDRQAMIEGMVAQLAARLKDNPEDVEGWKRLIRSYTVLGQTEAAREALAEASQTFAADSAGGREIAAFAEEIGLSAREETTTQ